MVMRFRLMVSCTQAYMQVSLVCKWIGPVAIERGIQNGDKVQAHGILYTNIHAGLFGL